MHQQLRIGGGLKDGPFSLQLAAQGGEVHQISVVGDGDRFVADIEQQRPDVLGVEAPGGGIAGMADGRRSRQPLQGRRIVVNLGNQTLAHMAVHYRAVHADDAGPLLPPVLLGIEAQIGQGGGFGIAVDTNDAAHGSVPKWPPEGEWLGQRCSFAQDAESFV